MRVLQQAQTTPQSDSRINTVFFVVFSPHTNSVKEPGGCSGYVSTNRLCVSSPGSVAAVAGGRSEGLAPAVWMPDFDVVLLPAQVLTQHSVGLVQLHKLAVQRWVGWVTVWVQLHDVTVMRSTDQTNQLTNKYSDAGMCLSGH